MEDGSIDDALYEGGSNQKASKIQLARNLQGRKMNSLRKKGSENRR